MDNLVLYEEATKLDSGSYQCAIDRYYEDTDRDMPHPKKADYQMTVTIPHDITFNFASSSQSWTSKDPDFDSQSVYDTIIAGTYNQPKEL